MMIAFLRKNPALFILNGSISPVYSSLSRHFCSSATETRPDSSPTISDILLHKYDFPPELVTRVASKLTHLKTPETADLVLSFFVETGFSHTQLVKIVVCKPRFLAGSVENTFRPKVKFFQEFGFSSDDICKLVTRHPPILALSLNSNIVPSLSVLNRLFGSNNELARAIMKSPRFLSANVEKTVLQNVEFLEICGIPMERIRLILLSYPRCFLAKPQVIRKSVEKAKDMGLDIRSNIFLYAIPTLASMSIDAWELKLQGFRDMGFSDSDISTMFSKLPQVFMGSMEKIKKIVELLLATRRFSLSSVVNYPQSLQCSIEKRYKPRLQILGILESRNLIEEWPVLSKICRLTDAGFLEKFIRPYLNEVGEFDIIKSYVKTIVKAESLGKNQ